MKCLSYQVVYFFKILSYFSAFGFVTFENVDVALAAKRGLIGAVLGPHMLRIGFAKTSISPKIFVGGLGDWCTNYRLWTEFDRLG